MFKWGKTLSFLEEKKKFLAVKGACEWLSMSLHFTIKTYYKPLFSLLGSLDDHII